jgi:hypothetical protein
MRRHGSYYSRRGARLSPLQVLTLRAHWTWRDPGLSLTQFCRAERARLLGQGTVISEMAIRQAVLRESFASLP